MTPGIAAPTDEMVLSLVVHEIKKVQQSFTAAGAAADGKQVGGWALIGFPKTADQAKALEKELSGFEPPQAGKPKVR